MIRKATTEDCGRMAEINVFGWRIAYRNLISDKYLFKDRSVINTYKSMTTRLMSQESEVYVHVDPSFWGCGIGSQMLNHFEVVAREKDKNDLYIWVLNENKRARRFYEKHGYKHDGKEKYLEPGNIKEVRYLKKL